MAVIDARLRPPTDSFKALRGRLRARPLPQWQAVTMDDFVKEMEELGVIGVAPGRIKRGGAVTTENLKEELLDKYPGRFIPLPAVDYTNRREAQREIDKAAKWGFKGISVELTLSEEDMLPDDRRLYPIYAQLEDLGLVCSIFTSPRGAGRQMGNNSPYIIDRVAADFPLLKIFLPHGCYPMIEEVIHLVWRRANVWISNDCYMQAPFSCKYVEACNYCVDEPKYPFYPYYWKRIQERFLYGSCLPQSSPMRERLDEFKSLGWREEILPKLLYHNAAQLFGLEGDITKELLDWSPAGNMGAIHADAPPIRI